jgi:hypothetical protein
MILTRLSDGKVFRLTSKDVAEIDRLAVLRPLPGGGWDYAAAQAAFEVSKFGEAIGPGCAVDTRDGWGDRPREGWEQLTVPFDHLPNDPGRSGH